MNSQFGSYVQPYQLTYEMYNNPISNNMVYDFKGLGDVNRYQQRGQSRIQTAATEQGNYNELYSQSYKEYLNGKYNQREEGRRRSQSKSMDDRENSRKIQEGGNIIHSISMNDMRFKNAALIVVLPQLIPSSVIVLVPVFSDVIVSFTVEPCADTLSFEPNPNEKLRVSIADFFVISRNALAASMFIKNLGSSLGFFCS